MQSMKELQSEEQKTNQFITKVANKSQQIDTQFLKYEAILEGLTIGATNLLTQGSPDQTPYYTNDTILYKRYNIIQTIQLLIPRQALQITSFRKFMVFLSVLIIMFINWHQELMRKKLNPYCNA